MIEVAKRILRACIEQVIEFDTKMESMVFIDELKASGRLFSINSNKQGEDGKVILHIRKQYNNNIFPYE